MEEYRVVSFSGGKDSTAMLLRLMELGEPINEVIFCDTTKEFPAMYRHVEKIKSVTETAGIKFTKLRGKEDFDYFMFEKEIVRKSSKIADRYGDVKGYSWASPQIRWCTGALKRDVVKRYLSRLKQEYSVVQYVGIAADETERLDRKGNAAHRHPLVEWGWTERKCLEYCYSKGYDWEGLYEKFKRVSCWCYPLQTLDELRALRRNFPDLWEKLRQMDLRTWRNFKEKYSVEQLEKRFSLEDERTARGLTISPHSKDFRAALKKEMGG